MRTTVKDRVARYLGTHEAAWAEVIAVGLGIERVYVITALQDLLREDRVISPKYNGGRGWKIRLKRGERAYPRG